MRKIYLVSAILVAAIGCAMFVPAIGASGHDWHGDHGMAMGSQRYDQLNLTDAQRSQIQQLTQQSSAQAKPQRQAQRQARQAWESAVPGTAAYQSATTALAQTEADAASARVTRQANLRAQVYQVLTAAQRSQLAQMQEQRRARMLQRKQESPLPSPTSSSDPTAQ